MSNKINSFEQQNIKKINKEEIGGKKKKYMSN